MSYDVYLVDPVTNETLRVDNKHHITGGTYIVGGSNHLHLNITYNYGEHFYRVFGEKGIHTLYGMTGAEAQPLLKQAMEALKNDVHEDYWKPTEGNAKQALAGLLAFAQLRPDGVFRGD